MSGKTISRPLGVVAAVVTTTAWGGQFVVGKSAFAYLDPVWLTALRYAAAGIVFVALLALVEGRAAFRWDAAVPRVAVLGTVGFAGFNLLVYVGLTRTSPQAASLIVSTMPLITAFVIWARTRLRPRAVTWWSSGVALLGVGLVLSDGRLGRLLDGGLGWGDVLVLLGSASWVVYTTGASTVPDWSPLRYTAISAAAGSLAILLVAFVGTAGGWLRLPTVHDVSAAGWQLAYVALVAAVVAVLCWNAAMRALGPQDGVLFINLVPVTTFGLEAVLGNVPHPAQLLGVAVTMAALVGNNLVARRGTPAPARPGRAAEVGQSGEQFTLAGSRSVARPT
jgi:drug/metabolite transporter (DMT)-like permease